MTQQRQKKLLGTYVREDIYDVFVESAWKQRLTRSQLLRQLIKERLENDKNKKAK